MWVVTFYRANTEPVEMIIPSADAPSRTLAILAAMKAKPDILDRSDDVDALELPDLEEGGSDE